MDLKLISISFVAMMFFLFLNNAYAEDTWKISIKPSIYDDSVFFTPFELAITSGDTVSWINHDSTVHKITSGVPNHPDYSGTFFESSELKPGEKYSKTLVFDDYAAYYYFCEIHPWYTGKVFFEDREDMQNSTVSFVSDVSSDELRLSSEVHPDFKKTQYEIIIFNENSDIIFHKLGYFSDSAKLLETVDVSSSLWYHDTQYFAKLIYGLPSESSTIPIDGLPLPSDNAKLCNGDLSKKYDFPDWFETTLCWQDQGLITLQEINDSLDYFSRLYYSLTHILCLITANTL